MNTTKWLLPLMILGASSAFADEAATTIHIYQEKCIRCHGITGAGDTPLGRKLRCKDYSSKQAQSLFTDAQALALIRDGKLVDGKQTMPAFKDELTDAEQQAMLVYLRNLAKRP